MKILHVINSLGGGGAEKLLIEILPLIKAKNHVVHVLVLSNKKMVFAKELNENKVSIRTLPSKSLYNIGNIYYLRKHIVEGKYDIVHAHLFPTIYWVSIASRLISKDKPKFVMTEHSTHNRRRGKRYLKYLESFIYSGFDKIVSVSHCVRDNLVSWLEPKKFKSGKYIVVENGINLKKYEKALPHKKSAINNMFTQNTTLLCMVGRFTRAKDQPTLIRAVAELPQDVHLLLVGEGILKDYCVKLADEIGVLNRVHFLGFRTDIERIIKTSDIIIQSSNWEGSPLAVLEGMAAGKPIIASNIPELREVVQGAGILFEKGDKRGLAIGITSLLESEVYYTHVANLCLNRAKTFDISATTNKTISVYEKLCRL